MQRELVKWLQGLDLSTPVRNPRRDLANGVAAAEIVSRCIARGTLAPPEDAGDSAAGSRTAVLNETAIDLSATSADAKRGNWTEVLRVLALVRCTSLSPPVVEAVMRMQPNAAQAALEDLYEFFTGRRLATRSADAMVAEAAAVPAAVQPAAQAGLLLQPQQDAAGRGATGSMNKKKKTMTPSATGTVAQGNYLNSAQAVQSAATLLVSTKELDAEGALAGEQTLTQTSESRGSGATGARSLTDGRALSNLLKSTTGSAAVSVPGGRTSVDGGPDALPDGVQANAAAVELQRCLALTRNAQLAAGVNGLVQPHGHYERPTASSLVHAANGSRFDVSLDKPKYAADERTAQLRNERIVAQHALLEKAYGEPGQTNGVTAAAARSCGGTNILQGPFAGNAATREAARRAARVASHRATSGDGRRASAACNGEGTGDGDGGSAPAVPHVKVNVLPDSLRRALERNGVYANGEEHAQAKSVQHFRQCEWHVQTALTLVLRDVLGGRGMLNWVLEHSCRASAGGRRDDAALEDLFTCVMGLHGYGVRTSNDERDESTQEMARSVLEVCWEAVGQQAAGIAAALLHCPSEYAYLLRAMGWAFSAQAARIHFLHVTAPSPDAERTLLQPLPSGAHSMPDRAASIQHALVAASRRRSSVLASGSSARVADARIPVGDDEPATAGERTHHGSSPETVEVPGAPLDEHQKAVWEDAEALHLAQAFLFLGAVGGAMHESPVVAASVAGTNGPASRQARWLMMERYFLPLALKFALARGTPASVQAVAAVLVHTLGTAETDAAAGGQDSAEAVRFLREVVQPRLVQQLRHPPEGCTADVRFALTAYHVLSQLYAQQRKSAPADTEADRLIDGGDSVCTEADSACALALSVASKCFARSDAASRMLGVGLLLQTAPTAALRSSELAAESTADSAPSRPDFLRLLRRYVLDPLSLADTTGQSVKASDTPTFSAASPSAALSAQSPPWEMRALALELLSVVSSRLAVLVAGDTAPTDAAAAAALSALRAQLEEAMVQCLTALASDPAVHGAERQLALSIVSRRLLPDVQPRLADCWLDLLQQLPQAQLQKCLLPCETQPLLLEASDQPWAGADRRADSPLPLRSSIRLLPGVVEPCYVVAPLNQSWNTSGVVHAVLRRLERLTPRVALDIVAAALLSPQPLSAQEDELVRNLRIAAPPPSQTAAAVSVDSDPQTSAPAAGDELEEDESALALTLRGVVGGAAALLRSAAPPSGPSSEASHTQPAAESASGDELARGVTYSGAFWRGALHRLAPLLQQLASTGDESAAAAASEDEDAFGGAFVAADDRETALAVLFTLFQKCATPQEVVSVNEARESAQSDALSCLLAWLQSCASDGARVAHERCA